MLYEFRSDARESLAEMEKHFEAAIAFYRTKGITVNVELVGDRPCSGIVDEQAEQALIDRAAQAYKRWCGCDEMSLRAGSTDCNIPMSMGIPAVCPGIFMGGGAHTREEWVEIASLPVGLKICSDIMLDYFEI